MVRVRVRVSEIACCSLYTFGILNLQTVESFDYRHTTIVQGCSVTEL